MLASKERKLCRECVYKLPSSYYRPTWIEIDLTAVRSNVQNIKKYIGDEVHLMAVVKANASGHGMVEIAETAISVGATWIGVATMDEAIIVRSKLSKPIPILAFNYISPEHLSIASKYKITVTALSYDWLDAAVKVVNDPIDFHIKLETGLNRVGYQTLEEVQAVKEMISSNSNMNWTGAYTHFATSEDMKDKKYFYQQLARFREFLEVIPDHKSKMFHCSNSCATLYHPEKPFFNMVRVGKAMLGPPHEELKQYQPFPIQTAISLRSILVLVKQLDVGQKISYSGEYTTTEKQWIGTIPIGYADGWQYPTIGVLVNGMRVRVVGRITMDQLMVALPKKYPIGTQVTLIGEQGKERIIADEIADVTVQPKGEIYTALSLRLPRKYIQDGSVVSIQNPLLDLFL